MTRLHLRLRDDTAGPVDASALVPHQLQTLSLPEIEQLPIPCGSRSRPIADLFDVTGQPADTIVISATSARLTRVAAHLRSGHVVIDGDAGNLAGSDMRGGRLTITGSAGDYLGSGMRAGNIDVTGSVGDFAGGALPAHRYGQRGGVIVIHGDAGARVGDCLRRGTLIVTGNCGAYAASRLIAGTVLIGGEFGGDIALGMRRGTLLLSDDACVRRNTELRQSGSVGELSRFVDGGPVASAYASLLQSALCRHTDSASWLTDRARRLIGDRLTGGQGEILLAP